MSITDKLKNVDALRRFVKKCKIRYEYLLDADVFCKYYMEESDKREDYEYRMLMFVHNIEKGMCMPNPRPFGKEKVAKLMDMIKACEKEERYVNSSAYKMSISILYQWVLFYKEHGWNDELMKMVDAFLANYGTDMKGMDVGYKIVQKQELTVNGNTAFDEVIKTRRAVRTFSDKKLEPNVVKECVLLAQAAPTACNRQMIKIYQISNRENCDIITDTIYGASGFTRDTVNYFVLTYDVKSLDYYGERNQGYLNAGLVAMNLANALHSRGIGSCFIQWANTASEEREVKKHLGISETEHIAVVLGAGYYADEMYIAKSCRRDMEEIFTSR